MNNVEREELRLRQFGLAMIHTYPAVVTEEYSDVLANFKERMRKEFGTCEELDSEWARTRIRNLRTNHGLDTHFEK